MTAPLLKAEGLCFSYANRHVLTMWDGAFAPGLTWLRGANGSGKSTLLKVLAGALEPFAGRRVAAGADAAADPLGYRRQVFWCGPGALAFDHLRAPEFFGFMATLYPRSAEAPLAEAVQGLGLGPFLGPRIAQLSSGNQRKVWLAAALAAGTPVVLLDEPFNALDAPSAAWLNEALARHARAAAQAWVVASHEAPAPGAPVATLDLPSP
ncbi:MAG: ATP-binding cassette domain-containing protein [Betaproteobacteria bacterium]